MNRKLRKTFSKVLAFFLAVLLSMQNFVPVANAADQKEAGVEVPISDAAAAARKMAEEGTVLLKNNNDVLPLAANTKVAVFGEGQLSVDGRYGGVKSGYRIGGGGSSTLTPEKVPNSPVDVFKATGLDVYEPLTQAYRDSCQEAGDQYNKYTAITYIPDTKMYDDAAGFADTAIMFITRESSESADRLQVKGDWYLTDNETNMLKELSARFDSVVVIANVPSAIDTTWSLDGEIAGVHVDAFLMAWVGGMEGPEALANILTGAATPSGKLADTFARSLDDYPSTNGFTDGRLMQYTEDIYVGYRYFETFKPDRVNYEFGFGLSYTDFDIVTNSVIADEENITVDVTVTNKGTEYSGKEVVQVYYGAPRIAEGSKFGNPVKELAAFQKTKELAPGESQNLTISFPVSDMASFDDTGVTGHESAYVLEPGKYNIYVGNSVKKVEPAYTYEVSELQVVEQLSELVAPNRLASRLRDDGSYEDILHGSDAKQIVLGDTAVTAECEDFAMKSAGFHVMEDGNRTYLHSTGSNNFISYPIQVKKSGLYTVSFNYRKTGDWYNPFNVFVNFNKCFMPDYRFAGSSDFTDSVKLVLSLNEGVHDLRFETNAMDMDLDKLTIEPFTGYDIPASGSVTWEAEFFNNAIGDNDYKPKIRALMTTDYQLTDSGTLYPYYNGGYGLDGMQKKDNSVTYNLRVAEAGNYTLNLKMSSKEEITDFVDIQINGKSVDKQFICPAIIVESGGRPYYPYAKTDIGVLELPAGDVELTFVAKTNQFPLLEQMSLTRVTENAVSRMTYGNVDAQMLLDDNPEEVIKLQDVVDGNYSLDEFVGQMTVEELAKMASGTARGYTGTIGSTSMDGSGDKYGIPFIGMVDGPAGLRASLNTYWPCETMLACTYNPELVETMGDYVGQEAVRDKVHVWLAPGMNIHRNPLCGRNFEYFSEDPLLTGTIAKAETIGFQKHGLGVTIKHFCTNNRETQRTDTDSIVSERALREIYLRGFQIVVEDAKPMCVMSSYNLTNGKHTAENPELLQGILRGEWGFDGLIMTDWNNGSTKLLQEVMAGNNVKMPTAWGQETDLVNAVNNGTITRELLENNAKDILRVIMKIRMGVDYKEQIIVASAGEHGSISPAGDVAVPQGGNKTFKITPTPGYGVADVIVDGVSVGAVSSYTFENVTAGHTIYASFKLKENYLEDVKDLIEATEYTVEQDLANTSEDVEMWLKETINAMEGMNGVVDKVNMKSFAAAVADPNGTDGSFTFTVTLKDFTGKSLETEEITGVVTRTPEKPENENLIIDRSKNHFDTDLTNIGTAKLAEDTEKGRILQGYFDVDTGDKGDYFAEVIGGNQSFTFEAYVRPVTSAGGTTNVRNALISKGNDATLTAFNFGAANFRAGVDAYMYSGMSVNDWHMLTGVYDGTTGDVILYLDGEQKIKQNYTGKINNLMGKLCIGAVPSSYGNPYDQSTSDISSIRVYSEALTADEVAASDKVKLLRSDVELWYDFNYQETPKSGEKKITSFVIDDQDGEINETNHTIHVTMPAGTEVNNLVPTVTVSDKATVVPASGVAQNFADPVTYTVTAEDGTTQEYIVTVKPDSDKEFLEDTIGYAKSQMQKEEYQNVIPIVKEHFEAALEAAETVMADQEATQEQVDKATEDLLKMIHFLDFIKGDTDNLKLLVDIAKEYKKENYTEDSWKVFEEALYEAEKVIADENALKDDVDKAHGALQKAMDELVRIPVDKSKLQKLITNSRKYVDTIDKYTSATAEIFLAVMETAQAVFEDEDATQSDVDDAYATLQSAVFNLRLIPDKNALEELINKVEGIDFSGYTAESALAVRNALASAKAVVEDPEVSQKVVDKAYDTLQTSINKLEKLTSEKDNDKTQNNDKNNDKNNGKEDTKKSAKTGDSMNVALWMLLMLTMAAGVVVMRRRRHS